VNSSSNPGGQWRTSRQPRTGTIAVRDSKDPGGPRLAFGPGQWRAFAAHVKATASTA
jgi:hypothetical protein